MNDNPKIDPVESKAKVPRKVFMREPPYLLQKPVRSVRREAAKADEKATRQVALSDLANCLPFDFRGFSRNNDGHQILGKIAGKPTKYPFPESEHDYVIKTIPLGAGSVVTSTNVQRNPLRQIVSRTPISDTSWSGTYQTIFYLETLECGHQVHSFPQNIESGKRRHRCAVCGEAQLAIKFPPQSVASPKKVKRSA